MSKKPSLVIFGKKVRALRKAAGFSSLEKFAEFAKISEVTYARIERGERNTTVLVLIKIALALNVEIGELMPSLRQLKKLKRNS